MRLHLHDRVRVKTFNATTKNPKFCDPEENYWKLIGLEGRVVDLLPLRKRAVVLFDQDVKKLGLYAYNEIPNTLFILESDLEII